MPRNNKKIESEITYADHRRELVESNSFQPHYGGITQGAFRTEPNISVRSPMGRDNYEAYRPNEAIPQVKTQADYQQLMYICTQAYERVGVIRSVIDMMSEFGAEGIEILHEDEGPNRFYKAWSRRINLEDRVERFLSWLYKAGNVVVRRKVGKLSSDEIMKLRRSGSFAADATPGEIPLEYTFYAPYMVELVGDYIGALSYKKVYGLKIPISQFINLSPRRGKTKLEEDVYNQLPPEIKQALEGGTKDNILVYPLPQNKIFVGHYKKDDSEIWGKSFIYSILGDVFYNDKLKLAKMGALDSFYNPIRIWALGDHTATPKPIFPSASEAAKISAALENHTGGGGIDIIWNSAIDLKEFYPPIERLANFEENINNILLGLGVPESLVGGENEGGGSANINFVGLKNLIKRLEAGRRIVKMWLEAEIDVVQKNMGFRKRPYIRFKNDDLFDERSYFNMLVQLVDRNILSDKTILERINEIPEIEKKRIQEETEERKSSDIPKKAGPFHNPEMESQRKHEIEKIKVQKVENTSNLTKKKNTEPKTRTGRPPGSKDTTKRQRRGRAESYIEAHRLYKEVEDFVVAKTLDSAQVKDVRSLSGDQREFMDKSIEYLFANTEPFTKFDPEKALNGNHGYESFANIYSRELASLGLDKLTAGQKKSLRIVSYIEKWGIESNEDISI